MSVGCVEPGPPHLADIQFQSILQTKQTYSINNWQNLETTVAVFDVYCIHKW